MEKIRKGNDIGIISIHAVGKMFDEIQILRLVIWMVGNEN